MDLHEKFTNFLNVQDRAAIFVIMIYLQISNHWVALVAHTPDPHIYSVRKLQKVNGGQSLTNLYYLDSMELTHLNKYN